MSSFRLFGWDGDALTNSILFFIAILFGISIFRIFYEHTRIQQYFPESTVLITFGLLIGLFIELLPSHDEIEHLLKINPEIYLEVIIPIIIFDATFFLNQQYFFANFIEILCYAIIGTLLNAAEISLLLIATKPAFTTDFTAPEILAFSSILSAIDPVAVIAIMEQQKVNANLFNLAFGEATLNDGVAIVLFNLFKGLDDLIERNYNFGEIFGLGVAKFLISVVVAMIVAFALLALYVLFTKISFRIPNIEVLLLLACPWLSYVLADALMTSGVISVMTSALLIKRYMEQNCSQKSKQAFNDAIHMLAEVLESFLFFSMGNQIMFTVFDETIRIDWAFALSTPLYCFVARAVGVVVQTAVLNVERRKKGLKISWSEQVVLIWCGLRGGIAFSLSKTYCDDLGDNNNGEQIVFATCAVIILTIFIFGLSMRSLIIGLKIDRESEQSIGFQVIDKGIAVVRSSIQALSGKSFRLREWLVNIDILLQKLFLKRKIPQNREILRIAEFLNTQNAESLQQDSAEELEEFEEIRKLRAPRDRKQHVRKSVSHCEEADLLIGTSSLQ